MDEEIDDFELMDDEQEGIDNTTTQNTNSDLDDSSGQQDYEDQEESVEDSLINQLLELKGITDSSKIKFENEEGKIDEVDWNTLDNDEKLNILRSSESDNQLQDSEIQLLNAIRQSNLTPQEYLQYVSRSSVENFIQNTQAQNRVYSTDQYSDEELYVMDLISKSKDITEEEALEALERAKSNSNLFKKQTAAIRDEYKRIEEDYAQQARYQQEEAAQEQFNRFASSIEDSILRFTDYSGYPINMDSDDMQDLYDFITTTDNAGNNWFSKALNDPDSVVQMAWFLLNGEKMIQDTVDYYNNEITKVRKESYAKGLKDAQDKPNIVYKNKSKVRQQFDDLDDF